MGDGHSGSGAEMHYQRQDLAPADRFSQPISVIDVTHVQFVQ